MKILRQRRSIRLERREIGLSRKESGQGREGFVLGNLESRAGPDVPGQRSSAELPGKNHNRLQPASDIRCRAPAMEEKFINFQTAGKRFFTRLKKSRLGDAVGEISQMLRTHGANIWVDAGQTWTRLNQETQPLKQTMKLLRPLMLILVLATHAGAQGLVYFNNNTVTKVSTNSALDAGVSGATATVANQFYYALFYSTSATAVHGSSAAAYPGFSSENFSGVYAFDDANWTLAAYGTNSPSLAGRFNSSLQNADGSTTINGVAGGATAQFVVFGWSANLGANVTDVASNLDSFAFDTAWIGESAVSGPLILGNGGVIPAALIFGTGGSPLIAGFTLGEILLVPEPSSLALGLAAVSLVLIRWKKCRAEKWPDSSIPRFALLRVKNRRGLLRSGH